MASGWPEGMEHAVDVLCLSAQPQLHLINTLPSYGRHVSFYDEETVAAALGRCCSLGSAAQQWQLHSSD